MPSKGQLHTGMPDQGRGPVLGKWTVAAVTIDPGPKRGTAKERTQAVGNWLYLPGQVAGSVVNFLVNTGSGVSILAARVWKRWGRQLELRKYWGRLCSMEGRALECMEQARLAVTMGTQDNSLGLHCDGNQRGQGIRQFASTRVPCTCQQPPRVGWRTWENAWRAPTAE